MIDFHFLQGFQPSVKVGLGLHLARYANDVNETKMEIPSNGEKQTTNLCSRVVDLVQAAHYGAKEGIDIGAHFNSVHFLFPFTLTSDPLMMAYFPGRGE